MSIYSPQIPVAVSAGKLRSCVALVVGSLGVLASGAQPATTPLLELSSGLPGQQAGLSWVAVAGQRYRVEKSTTLGGAWTQVALVEADGAAGRWLDSEPAAQKAFYRVAQPVAEVFSIASPLLSATGGEVLLRGQAIPAGSLLVVEIDGQAAPGVLLEELAGGVWRADVTASLVPGGSVIAARIVDAAGTTVVTLNQPLTVTASGRALDSPASLPPGAPLPQALSNPIPGIGIVVKHNPRPAGKRMAGDDDDGDGDSADAADANDMGGFMDQFDTPPIGVGSKRGYDYYKAQSDLSAARSAGVKHPDLMKREMGPAAITPAPSGLPGEVSFQTCDLALACPAGPQLAWVRTYRSMKPLSAGHGTGWDFSYHIWIEALPSSAGASAARVRVHDGGGRDDIFQRQADGTYRCEGQFREGRFTGETFTLTFADQGTWTFNPLDSSPAAGKIAAITDRNGVALSCAYNSASGRLATVSDSFSPPRSLSVAWGADGFIASVADSSGRSVYFAQYGANDTDGGAGDLKSASCPQIAGISPVTGATVYTYATGNSDPNLNSNLLSVTDGAGKLLESFTYSAATTPTDIAYDACASHDRGSHGSASERCILHYELLPSGDYAMIENDELGHVTEAVCDRQHRVVRWREFTGAWTPGTAVSVADLSNPVHARLREGDPAYFETSCGYNADSLCMRITAADGSQELVTYDRDFRPTCPVRERANPRVVTLRSPGGEERVVTCTYQPDRGNPESASPGCPIGESRVKGGVVNGSIIVVQSTMDAAGGIMPGLDDWQEQSRPKGWGGSIKGNRKGWDGSIKGNRKGWDGSVKGNRKGWDGSVKGNLAKEEGGRHTPFHNKPGIAAITAGAVAGIVVGTCAAGEDEDCDGTVDDDDERKIGPKQKAWLCSNFRLSMVNAHGQVSSWTYDEHGNCTSALSPLPDKGVLYQYNGRGQCTASTVLNGPGSSFHDEFSYTPAAGFLAATVRDSAGLHLTTAVARDPLGRVTAVTDARGNDWLYGYNPLDQCVQVQSPAMPERISMNLTIDAGGRVARCDADHRAPDGTLDAGNPAYSTFFVYDERARLVRVADEERPVNGSGLLAPDSLGIENFAVRDCTYDAAGQVVRVSTPAACRAQAVDRVDDFSYDERGLPYRCVEGGSGSAAAVTTGYDYDLLGACVRCATLADGAASPETLVSYDGFHRLATTTDPMGNVAAFEYDNQGFVTTSVYGQANDVPGTKGNTLLWRCRQRPGLIYQTWGGARARGAGNNAPTLGLSLPGGGDAFFQREADGNTLTVERFSPGDTGTHATEVTVVDRSPAGLLRSVTCNGDLLVACGYDSAGRHIRCQDGTCAVDCVLDAGGNVTAITRTDISGAAGFPNKTYTVARAVDPFGRCTQTTDGIGNTRHAAYDSLGRCVAASDPGGLSWHTEYDGTSSLSGPFSARLSADAAGAGSFEVLAACLVRSGECRSTTDSHGQTTTHSRDSNGRAARCDYPDATYDECYYDPLGNHSGWRCQDSSLRSTAYDLIGRPVSRAWSALPGGVVAVPQSTYHYDGLGRCVSAAQGESSVTFTYDSCGNPTSETQDGFTVSRTFTHRGRSAITYQDGRRLVETRDPGGLLLAVAATSDGTVVAPPVAALEYLGRQVARCTQGNGLVSTFSYRGDGDAPLAGGADASFDACVRETVSTPAAIILSDTIHRRDANQRQTNEATTFAAGLAAPGRAKSFTLDRLGRVTRCVTRRREGADGQTIIESDVNYTLDLEGRRLTATGGANPGSYTQADTLPPGDLQMGQYSSWPRGPLEWDANGNLSLMTTASSQLAFVHDAEGRLVAVNDPSQGTAVITYGYDALGRRSTRSPQTGAATRFLYDGSRCIQELGPDGLADMTFVGADGLSSCVATRNGTVYYLACQPEPRHTRPGNHRPGRCDSSTILVTNAAGQAVERCDGDDAGKPVFLSANGITTAATSSAIGLRWLAPEASWEPETAMFHAAGGIHSPDLGLSVSKKKDYVGHVTLIKQ